MDLNVYDIIKSPVNSDKAYKCNVKERKLVLFVHCDANRIMIKKAVEAIFGVVVEKVNTQIRKGKLRTVGRRKVEGSKKKIAIITLSKGSVVDLFNHLEAQKNNNNSE